MERLIVIPKRWRAIWRCRTRPAQFAARAPRLDASGVSREDAYRLVQANAMAGGAARRRARRLSARPPQGDPRSPPSSTPRRSPPASTTPPFPPRRYDLRPGVRRLRRAKLNPPPANHAHYSCPFPRREGFGDVRLSKCVGMRSAAELWLAGRETGGVQEHGTSAASHRRKEQAAKPQNTHFGSR